MNSFRVREQRGQVILPPCSSAWTPHPGQNHVPPTVIPKAKSLGERVLATKHSVRPCAMFGESGMLPATQVGWPSISVRWSPHLGQNSWSSSPTATATSTPMRGPLAYLLEELLAVRAVRQEAQEPL